MDTATELDELVKSFSEWRANKKTRAVRLPPELLRRARELRVLRGLSFCSKCQRDLDRDT